MVCKTWRSLSLDPAMWRVIDMRLDHEAHLFASPHCLEKTCRLAIDRSQGQLVDVSIEFFATDDLLNYIAQRSGYLRRLRLVLCYDLSSEGLSKAIRNFPLLEELQHYYVRITKEAIEAIGRSCLLLESFRLNHQGSRRPQIEYDKEAFAIAESMPTLRHLQLFGNKMTNEGLKAILDGCPHLKSLDIRQWFNVSFAGSLERKCSLQVKHLKRPFDSTEDYGFDTSIEDYESSDEDCPFGFSDIDFISEDNDYHEFSDLDGEYSDCRVVLD